MSAWLWLGIGVLALGGLALFPVWAAGEFTELDRELTPLAPPPQPATQRNDDVEEDGEGHQ